MAYHLVLLHGALGNEKQFSGIREELEKIYNVYTFNFDGHGGKEINADFSMELFTQNFIDFLESNNLDHAAVFGYSMGGYVALKAALRVPQKITKIMHTSMLNVVVFLILFLPDVVIIHLPRFQQHCNDIC